MEHRTQKKGIFVAMMTPEEYELLCSPEIRQAVEENLGRDPLKVALDRRVPQARLVASQVKYLARCATKLPSYAAARCIIPPLAFEQASSEACAAHKGIAGDSALDLTCGLGVDTLFLSRCFRSVTALERDPLLARITRENLARMGVHNVEVIATTAEEYLHTTTAKFDWIYADPDRRSTTGRKLVRLEECSPQINALRPDIDRIAGRLCVKNSPLFDVDEAFTHFGACQVEVVSLGGECKEVVIRADGNPDRITATALGLGTVSYARADAKCDPCRKPFDPRAYHWLILPDVALRKARLTCRALRDLADVWSNEGYGFTAVRPEGVIGRIFAIAQIEPYNPKVLRRTMKGTHTEILKHDFPLSVEQIAQQLGIRQGGTTQTAFTKIGDGFWVIRLI